MTGFWVKATSSISLGLQLSYVTERNLKPNIVCMLLEVSLVPANGGKVATLTGGPANSTYEFRSLAQNHVYDTPNARCCSTEDDVGYIISSETLKFEPTTIVTNFPFLFLSLQLPRAGSDAFLQYGLP